MGVPVAGGGKAVFLSYASEDSEAAVRIAEALKAAGIEVWFDKSELRGGDAWDRTIRQRIHDCQLFIPVISVKSEARAEGYFRREWKLAVERTHDMSERVTFIVPVVVDGTRELTADVPDTFRSVQWTRLPAGETPAAFVERLQRLLAPETALAHDLTRSAGSTVPRGAPPIGGVMRRRKAILYGISAAAVLLALGFLGLERLRGPKSAVQGAASIAVLPLANESGDPSQQYFSDGISEDLITALGQFPGLKVIGRTSSFQFRDSKEDSRSIGAKLGVAHLLEGSVRRSGDMIRVSAELIDTADGSMQWSERYDRPYKELFALQDEITHSVTSSLRAKLLPGEHAAEQSDRPPSGSLEAYNALLQGQFFAARSTESDLRKAIESYTEATQLDPSYALAWSRLARVWDTLAGVFLAGAPAQEAYAKGRKAADRALALSPQLTDAHIARGHLLEYADFDWHGAEAEFRRALELAPNDAQASFSLGTQLATLGAVEQAVDLTRQALATEPLRAGWYDRLAVYLSGLNRLDEAERASRRAIELQPAAELFHQTLTIIEVQRGRAETALAAALQEPSENYRDPALALARQIGGDRNAANVALQTLIDNDASFAAYQIAQIYALRDQATETFEWLDRAWSNHDTGLTYLLFDPFILRYRDDPRFAAFCRKVGLPAPGDSRQQDGPARSAATIQ